MLRSENFITSDCRVTLSTLVQQYQQVFKRPSDQFKEQAILNHLCHKSPFAIKEVSGLCYIPDYISSAEADQLISLIDSKPWNTSLKRRTQHYGFMYDYTAKNAHTPADPIPKLINDLRPFRCDQVIVNEYEAGQGIGAHTDHTVHFDYPVATLSLLSSIPMVFRKGDLSHTVLLKPNSLVVMIDEARYEWTHEIPARKKDEGVPREKRVSVTYRRKK